MLFYASEKPVRVGEMNACATEARFVEICNLVLLNTILIIHAHSVQVFLLFMKLHLCGNALQPKNVLQPRFNFPLPVTVYRIPTFRLSSLKKKEGFVIVAENL